MRSPPRGPEPVAEETASATARAWTQSAGGEPDGDRVARVWPMTPPRDPVVGQRALEALERDETPGWEP